MRKVNPVEVPDRRDGTFIFRGDLVQAPDDIHGNSRLTDPTSRTRSRRARQWRTISRSPFISSLFLLDKVSGIIIDLALFEIGPKWRNW